MHSCLLVFRLQRLNIKGDRDMIEIKEVVTKRDRKEFIDFPDKLYKDVKQYTPCIYFDEKMNLDPKVNPAYEYCESKMFLAYKDGKVAGRICAILNRAANEKTEKKRVRFSRFDAIDDIEVTKALFFEVERWALEKGMNELNGPIGFCDLDKQGMLVEGFDEMNLSLTLYNFPYYVEHMEKLGFIKEADWVEYQIKVPETVDARMERLSEVVQKRSGVHLIPVKRIKDVVPYIPSAFEIVNEAFAPLYGVVPLTQKQIDMYVKQFINLVNVDYVYIVADKNEDIVGFGLAVPSLAEAVKKCGGRLFPFGWYHLLKAIRGKHEIIELYLIAVKPELQGRGINSVILSHAIKMAIKNGVKLAETGPELEQNEKVQSQWNSFETRQHRRRRCYIKEV